MLNNLSSCQNSGQLRKVLTLSKEMRTVCQRMVTRKEANIKREAAEASRSNKGRYNDRLE